jgi:hypothetical protein
MSWKNGCKNGHNSPSPSLKEASPLRTIRIKCVLMSLGALGMGKRVRYEMAAAAGLPMNWKKWNGCKNVYNSPIHPL